MNEKLTNIGLEIIDIFDNNNLTYGECLEIIYILKESIEHTISDNVKTTIESTIKTIIERIKI